MDPREVIACPATVTVMWPRARLHNLRGEVIPTQFRSILLTHSAPMVARRPKLAQPQPPRMSVDEQRLARLWHAEDGLGPTEIGARLRRSAGSISRLLAVGPGQNNAVGRPRKLTDLSMSKYSVDARWGLQPPISLACPRGMPDLEFREISEHRCR